jgi:RNA polymerase sigma-70 factor (TIGR02943 family)
MSAGSSGEDGSGYPNLLEPTEWLKQCGDELYRYALARLRRPHDAEDAVQETLLAAFKAQSQFECRSHPRTWLIGILKNKILDRMRAEARQAAETDPAELDAWFDASGHWRQAPKRWDDPTAGEERAEFWHVVRNCLAQLPARMAEAFTLRTIEEKKGNEVCRELGISPANLWVLLHRARLRLVRCLENHWFNVQEES